MEWLADNPERGETVLALLAFGVTVIWVAGGVAWLGRRRLGVIITVAAIWLLLAMIAIPSFIPARNVAFRNACINNLRQLREAKIAWDQAEHKLPTDRPTEANLYGANGTNGYLRHPLVCPGGGQYTLGTVGENPACSLAAKGHKLD